MRDRTSHDEPLSTPDLTALRALVDAHGERAAVQILDVSASALARGLAGLRLRRSTRTAIRLGLAARAREAA